MLLFHKISNIIKPQLVSVAGKDRFGVSVKCITCLKFSISHDKLLICVLFTASTCMINADANGNDQRQRQD